MLGIPVRLFGYGLTMLLGLLLWGSPLRAEDVVTTKRVTFKPGQSALIFSGKVKGYDSMRYELEAKKGEKLAVRLTSKSAFLYFNLLNKRTDTALETEPAPREVTQWSGSLPEAGIYAVQVYLVRAEARRGHTARYRLTIKKTTK